MTTYSNDESAHGNASNDTNAAEAAATAPTTDPTTTSSVPRVPQPIFATVTAPKVTSTSRDALVEWLKLRKEYEEAMKERCKDGKEDIDAVLRSVKSSFDDDLLETLCEASWGVEKSAVDDDFLLKKIHEITDSYQNQVLPPVNELFLQELKMKMTNTDIQSRVTDYFLSCNSLIKKYGFTSFFEGDKGAKKKCKLLVNSLPKGLKEKVKNEIDYRCPEAQTSVLLLSKLVNQQALEQAIEDRALKRERGATSKDAGQYKKRQNPAGPEQHQPKRPKNATRSVVKAVGPKPAAVKNGPQTGCFHCHGKHYLSDCPTATEKDRERLDPKKGDKGGTSRAGRHR